MNIYEQRVKFRQHACQRRSDPAGKSAWDTSPDPDYLHVFYLPQPAQNLPETLRGKQQRVAARQEHVLYLFAPGDVVQGGRKIERIFDRGPMAALPLPLAGTEPAMDGALVAHQPQDAIRISVHQAWNRRQCLFRERVLKTGRVRNLFRIRDCLFPDSVPGA